MKRITALIFAILILSSTFALADKKVTANGVGKQTKSLKYKITDSGIDYWTDSIDSKHIFAFIAIKNTEKKKYIYLDNCNFDYEDDKGHLIDSESMVHTTCSVIGPGETGYFYVSGINGGYLDDTVNLSNGVNLIAQFSLEESKKKVESYEISDLSLSWMDRFNNKNYSPVLKGRILNNTDEDDNLVYVTAVLKDKNKKVLWISGTNVSDLYSGSTLGFSIAMDYASPKLKKGAVKYYKAYAKPDHHQF